ncbi:MAG: hypothetical protein QOJ09_2570, partial [Actinomycetota bacterium]|nr:hypothetical protein [Actinomycetota bacterium]
MLLNPKNDPFFALPRHHRYRRSAKNALVSAFAGLLVGGL